MFRIEEQVLLVD